jgi:tetratricopeptide (TPR) repeat protein
VASYSTRDIVRNGNWKDAITLYQHDVKNEPDNYSLQSVLGIELYSKGKYEEAKTHILRSIELYPTNQNWTALGLTYDRLNNTEEAIKALRKALEYKDDSLTYQSLVKIMLVQNSPEETAMFIKQELQNHSDDPVLWLYLAVEDYKLGKRDEALSEVQKSFNLYPSNESRYVYQQILNNQPIKLNN